MFEACQPSKNDRATLLFLLVGSSVLLLTVCVPCLHAIFPSCPVYKYLGFNCPGCGLTRACICLLHLDIAGAILYNPLWIIVVPYLLWRLGVAALAVGLKRRPAFSMPRWVSSRIQCVFLACWCVLAGVRIASWIFPACNPHGLLLP